MVSHLYYPEVSDHCIDLCNSLLRGEMAAVETYGQVLAAHEDSPFSKELRQIRARHTRAVNLLSQNVREMGGQPEHDSGAWGWLAANIQGSANFFGEHSARETLQKGEEMGRTDYQEALLDPEVPAPCKRIIRDELLPNVIDHIASLERMERAG